MTRPGALFEKPYRALVLGATGAIGHAFVQAFQADAHCTHVETISRSAQGFDLLDAETIRQHAQRCQAMGPFDVITDATGALTLEGVGPEKSLASVREDVLLRQFHLNAIGPLLALRHFSPLLASGPSIYAKLSARVGSISDNQKGGWYGYRAAKAALNMYLQTAAIELQRKNPELRVVALQPGTVRSELSKRFTASLPNLLEPQESVAGMWSALRTLPAKAGASFVDHKGEPIDW